MDLEQVLSGQMAPRQRKVVGAVLRHANHHGIQVGGRLPSIRDIAANTGIAHATVAKAIKHLSEAGVVESRGRNGTILIKSLDNPSDQTVQRLIMVQHVEDPSAAALSSALFDFELRNAIKTISPGIDIVSVYHTPQDGEELVERVIDYHYISRGKPAGLVFVLGGCPAPIKLMFEKRRIPSVILGGREEGVSLPNVTANIGSMVEQVMQLIQDADAFPAMFLVDIDILFGEQAEMTRRFTALARKSAETRRPLTICRTSSLHDVFHAQLTQVLRDENRPRTLIARGDESATRVARVCAELGLLNQVRIISMESTALGQRFIPSLTGLHRDVQGIIRSVLALAGRISRGEDVSGMRLEAPTVMIYRESFPNPYSVASKVFTPLAAHAAS